jgi:hypothetical protein
MCMNPALILQYITTGFFQLYFENETGTVFYYIPGIFFFLIATGTYFFYTVLFFLNAYRNSLYLKNNVNFSCFSSCT